MGVILSLFFVSYYGAPFLTLYPGAQATGLGGAYTAIAENSYANFYNPAGLGFQKEFDFSFENNVIPWFDKPNHWDFSAVVPLYNNYCFGLLGSGVKFDGEYFGSYECAHQYALGLSCGYKLSNFVSVGLAAKAIRHTYCWLDNYGIYTSQFKGSAYAADFGILGKYPIKYGKFGCGVVLQNIGTKIKYSQTGESDPLPVGVRAGISYRITQKGPLDRKDWRKDWLNLNWCVTVGYDINILLTKMQDGSTSRYIENPWHSFGIEIKPIPAWSVRLGYFYDKNPNDIDKRIGWTYGMGFDLKFLRFDISEDKPFFYMPRLINRYRISLSLNIGEPFFPKNGLLNYFLK